MSGQQVFVVMVCDRHTDPDPVVFAERRDAVAWARSYVEESDGQHRRLTAQQREGGWLYHGEWSTEGEDYVYVMMREVR